jgi:hypothetical protein
MDGVSLNSDPCRGRTCTVLCHLQHCARCRKSKVPGLRLLQGKFASVWDRLILEA